MLERILVVDDDESMRKMLQFFLVREGYRVDAAGGVEEAVEAMKSNEYRIMLIDKNMPGLAGNEDGGIDVLKYVRSASLPSAVIMMSGNPTADAIAAAAALGVTCFMPKPFSLLVLRQTLKTLPPGPATPAQKSS